MTPLLDVRALSVRYGRATAVDNVSFTVGAGEVLAVFGRNGAGKSSLLHAVVGIQGHEGEVAVDGAALPPGDATAAVRAGVAIVLERRGLFADMTVEQNLEVAHYGRGLRSRRAIRRAGGLQGAYDAFPVLHEKRRETAGSLSGGQQQMLAIGRALVCAPRLLLLDEPSLGLAPKVTEAVFEAIAGLRSSGMAMLLVEENPQRGLGVADRVVVMDRGQFPFTADAGEARRSPQTFRDAYFGRSEPDGAAAEAERATAGG
ncbi:MAG: ABC transporter ATP-binding protein [Pseudonocardia sp.]|uniref:ABC transporter ATP-binding protein n=1 Tax=unclassified Pseudonocardia TaxID=2619320 RepID=UPI00086C1B79|nr:MULTISPECIES: ABC transporter ATP-binding protein [unclassified Pseudonocardia]MBN9110481.1 ABC transporter ATP-binding protein [Pseudonocardia sp.]ODU29801.1 MAG: hypothetical protein ABS80_01430 [Pseudonocardia sp. SCN 72-51]ODV03440.1 MAG: hypothetical protein ABT15_22665 [Pseudonocardia sp. SCN 73-27]